MFLKKGAFVAASLTLFGSFIFLASPKQVEAHGYVSSPISRGYQGRLHNITWGWTAAHRIYGNVISNPQSLEYRKGFPEAGPRDGRIASAEGGLGQIGDFVLDHQTADRWTKQPIQTGRLNLTWTYTALHRTTKWHYYMTKPGCNPNQPLKRASFEKISEIPHDGTPPIVGQSHTISIPNNRLGYHVILAVWDIADTPNAFYNVIDANISPGLGI